MCINYSNRTYKHYRLDSILVATRVMMALTQNYPVEIICVSQYISSKGDPPCIFAGTLANYIKAILNIHINTSTVAALLSLSRYDK